MNREELNWLLQTMKDGASAERFVLAQYERGRISFQLIVDIARERGWINGAASQFATTTTCYLTEFVTAEFPISIA